MHEFERTRIDLGGQPVTTTSWYDAEKRHWRASAPGFLHLLAQGESDPHTGATRNKAVQSVTGFLARRFGPGRHATRPIV